MYSNEADTVPEIPTTSAGSLGKHAVDDLPSHLTSREADILQLIATGMTNNEIASHLYLSINSVKTYIRGAYRKIGASSRTQAVLWSVRAGLVDPMGAE